MSGNPAHRSVKFNSCPCLGHPAAQGGIGRGIFVLRFVKQADGLGDFAGVNQLFGLFENLVFFKFRSLFLNPFDLDNLVQFAVQTVLPGFGKLFFLLFEQFGVNFVKACRQCLLDLIPCGAYLTISATGWLIFSSPLAKRSRTSAS